MLTNGRWAPFICFWSRLTACYWLVRSRGCNLKSLVSASRFGFQHFASHPGRSNTYLVCPIFMLTRMIGRESRSTVFCCMRCGRRNCIPRNLVIRNWENPQVKGARSRSILGKPSRLSAQRSFGFGFKNSPRVVS